MGWADEYRELKAALTQEEYEMARASTLNAHYTSPTVIRAIYSAVEQMGFRKFRNVWNSSRLVAEISDELCREHHLSVVQNPQYKSVPYNCWEGDHSSLTSRDSLRITIDAALRMQPDGFDALMQLLEDAGCWIKRGAHVSIKPPGGKRYIRLDSLGPDCIACHYTKAEVINMLDK